MKTFFVTALLGFVSSIFAQNIASLEYYIDNDPGYGNGITVDVPNGPNLDVNFVANLDEVSPGLHILYIRGKDDAGNWSLTSSQLFLKEPNVNREQPSNITSIHWFYSKGTEVSNEFVLAVPNPAPKIDELLAANLSSLVRDETYNLHVYAKDSNGTRSIEEVRQFKVADNGPPLIRNFPDTVTFRNDGMQTINLWDIVTDLETPDAGLTYLFNVSNDSVLFSHNALTGLLTLSAKPNFVGSSVLRFEVRDPSSAFAKDSALVLVLPPSTAVDERNANAIPSDFELLQNYPNPFNPSTIIRFGLPNSEHVKLEIFDTLGRRIVTLLDGRKAAGYHEVELNAPGFVSGIYVYRLRAGQFTEVRKMLLLR